MRGLVSNPLTIMSFMQVYYSRYATWHSIFLSFLAICLFSSLTSLIKSIIIFCWLEAVATSSARKLSAFFISLISFYLIAQWFGGILFVRLQPNRGNLLQDIFLLACQIHSCSLTHSLLWVEYIFIQNVSFCLY